MSYVGIGNRQDYIADFPTQSFNGDGSTTTFTLNFEAVTGSVRVAVDNVLQPADGTSYYTNGNSITFTSAPATGTANITVTYLGTVRNISSVSDNAITTAKLADGAVTNAKLANSSITLNGSAVSLGGSATILEGITDIDRWRVATSFTNSLDPIVYTRNTDSDSPQLGTAMTQSSGIFSFPSTGFWMIHAFYGGANLPTAGNINSHLAFSTDSGSNYSQLCAGLQNSNTYSQWSITMVAFLDVTNISTFRVKSYINVPSSAETYGQNNGNNLTRIDFLRIGDT